MGALLGLLIAAGCCWLLLLASASCRWLVLLLLAVEGSRGPARAEFAFWDLFLKP